MHELLHCSIDRLIDALLDVGCQQVLVALPCPQQSIAPTAVDFYQADGFQDILARQRLFQDVAQHVAYRRDPGVFYRDKSTHVLGGEHAGMAQPCSGCFSDD
jgi:hypothetical protein